MDRRLVAVEWRDRLQLYSWAVGHLRNYR